jgi:hypothetical protein
MVLSVGCAGPTNDRRAEVTGASTAPSTTLPHPDSITGFDWKVGDVCTYQYQYGSRKSMHTQTLSDISAGRITFSDKGDDASGGSIVLESGGAQLKQWVSQANGEQLEFVPPLDWMSFPLRPDQVWSVQSAMIGQTFQADTNSTFNVGNWEQVQVPAGKFVALRITVTQSYIVVNNKGERNTGTGTWSYWVATSTNCLVKHEYQTSFGDKSDRQLLTYKKR